MKATDPARLIDLLLDPTSPTRLPPPSLRRQYRLAVGLTQQQVADVVATVAGQPCDRSTVGRWERELGKGGRGRSLSAKRLPQGLGCSGSPSPTPRCPREEAHPPSRRRSPRAVPGPL